MGVNEIFLKVRRKVIKRYIKLTRPKKYWDMAQYWPDVKVFRGVYYYRDKLIGSAKLTEISPVVNKELGSLPVINIIGSGPSVKDLDFRKLENHVNIFLNGSISLAVEHKIPVFAHVIMDPYFVLARMDLIKNDIQEHNLILSPGALCAIAERDISVLERNRVFVFNKEMFSEENMYSTDINKYVVDGGSVICIAMQIVEHIFVKEVRLLGLDIGNAGQPRFYETSDNVQRNGLMDDFEHKIKPFMQAAALSYKHKGIKLLNCSPISKLPYEIIPYWDGYQRLEFHCKSHNEIQ